MITKILLTIGLFLSLNVSFASDSPAPNTGSNVANSSIVQQVSPTVIDTEKLAKAVDDLKIDENPTWLKMIRYRKKAFGGFVSVIDNKEYFVSSNGKTNPIEEAKATIRGFFDPSKTHLNASKQIEHLQCQFPARFQFFKKQIESLKRDDLNALWRDGESKLKPKCEKWDMFRERVEAKSVSLIFSSYYLNNPSSAFGHTFLRLNKGPSPLSGKRYELLDQGINFAANATSTFPPVYAVSGIFGLFDGTFTVIPYYFKVREYNDAESRDLWEYDLNLSQEKVDFLVAHIWELGSSSIDYYFLDENCSYHILATIEVVFPEQNWVESLPPVVLPSETVRAVFETPGVVSHVGFRPAQRRTFRARIDKLTSDEIELLSDLIQTQKLDGISNLEPVKKAKILDAAIDHTDMKHFKELVSEDETEVSRFKHELLIARSELQVPFEPIKIEPEEQSAPQDGHLPTRFGFHLSATPAHKGVGFGIDYRFALHDLTDSTNGYPEGMEIEFFRIKVRAASTKLVEQSTTIGLTPAGKETVNRYQAYLDDFTFFQVKSLAPLFPFDYKTSWRVKMGAERFIDGGCHIGTAKNEESENSENGRFTSCFGPTFQIGAGTAINLFGGQSSPQLTLFGLGVFEADFTPSFERSRLRFGLGPHVGLRFTASRNLHALLDYQLRGFLLSSVSTVQVFSFEAKQKLTSNFSLGLKAEIRDLADLTAEHRQKLSPMGTVSIYSYF